MKIFRNFQIERKIYIALHHAGLQETDTKQKISHVSQKHILIYSRLSLLFI